MIEVSYLGKKFLINKESEYNSLHSKGFGIHEKGKFYLNVYEVLFLLDKKKIKLIDSSGNDLEDGVVYKDKSFDSDEYIVFKDLRSKGYIVKTGSKYGSSFRIYDKGVNVGKGHSIWLVEVLNSNKISIKDIVGKNRIAHGAKKSLIFAVVDIDKSIVYIENSWKKL